MTGSFTRYRPDCARDRSTPARFLGVPTHPLLLAWPKSRNPFTVHPSPRSPTLTGAGGDSSYTRWVMPPGPPTTLSKEEFEQLLQRAAERHTLAEPRDFTVAELLEAGRELGIDEQTVLAVHAEHEHERATPARRPRPFDSNLDLRRGGDTLRLVVPPRPGTQVAKVVRGLAGAALALVLGAAMADSLGAAIGGLIAAGVLFFSVRSARTRRELRLRRDGSGLLVRFVGDRGRGIPLLAGQVRVRLAERTVSRRYGSTQVEFLALDHGTETYELLEDYSHPERAWVLEEIEGWLQQ
jgi:hypothetical protein